MSAKTTNPAPVATESKGSLAREFRVSVRTFMRWVKDWNDALPENERLDLTKRIFRRSEADMIRAAFS
ncbi:hypothetical protein Q5H93_02935 [Hymenobacter sp. ASUV-10]|uniref:Helix-turn-helix domain-containing protein n=1 Tax=Hymenobacter aranciens TaxID=3063996 RepID=A0ABT9B5X6_9BACT|nr:hypothetical protein [Hymenobacter sp. ASUV-10]MDO7873674.1 hypothetical protein [Hymenobacter sp. ASUV-10]